MRDAFYLLINTSNTNRFNDLKVQCMYYFATSLLTRSKLTIETLEQDAKYVQK